MKILRYLIFVPAFYLIVILSRMLENFLLRIVNNFYSVENSIWLHFMILCVLLMFAIVVSLTIFPDENKKIGFFILSTVVLVSTTYFSYLIFKKEDLNESLRMSTLIDIPAHLITFISYFLAFRKTNFEN